MGPLDVSTEGMAAHFFVHVPDDPFLAIHSGFADLVPNGPLFLQGSGHSMPVQLITWQRRVYLAAGWPEFMLSNGIRKGDILFCQLNREMKMSVRVCSQAADTKMFVNRISGRVNRISGFHKEKNECGKVGRPRKRSFNPVENAEESLYVDEEDELTHKKKRKGPQPEAEVDGAEEDNTTHASHHAQKHLTKNLSATNLQPNQEHVGNVDAEKNEEQIKGCTKHTPAADPVFYEKEKTHRQHEGDDEQGNENGNNAAHKSFTNKPFRSGFRLKRIRRSRHEEDHDEEHVEEEVEEEGEDEEHEEEEEEEEEEEDNDAEHVGNISHHQKHVRRNNLSSTWRMKKRMMKPLIQEHDQVNEPNGGRSHYNKKKKGYNRFVVSSGEEEEEDNVPSLPWHIKRKTKSTPTKHMPSPEEEEGVFQIEITRHRLSTGCNIPAAYARYFPSGEATSIYIIGPEGIKWRMGVGYTKCRYPVLSPGWRGFQKHYKLTLDDVLCFRMINCITFKVRILRASQLLKNWDY